MVWPDDSSFLLCKYGVLLCFNVYTSIPCKQNRAILLSEFRIFKIYHARILRKLNFIFRQMMSLQFFKSSLTQNWKHCPIFEELFISYWKWTYASSCSYVLSHRYEILLVSIYVAIDDLTGLGWHITFMCRSRLTFPYSATVCQNDYRHASLNRHMQGLSNTPSISVFG